MRLPTVTAGQIDRENAREIHEALWLARQERRRILVPTAYDTPAAMQGALHAFWISRGFTLHCRKHVLGIEAWLEANAAPSPLRRDPA